MTVVLTDLVVIAHSFRAQSQISIRKKVNTGIFFGNFCFLFSAFVTCSLTFFSSNLKKQMHYTQVRLARIIEGSSKSLQSRKTQFPVSQNADAAHYRQIMRRQSW